MREEGRKREREEQADYIPYFYESSHVLDVNLSASGRGMPSDTLANVTLLKTRGDAPILGDS